MNVKVLINKSNYLMILRKILVQLTDIMSIRYLTIIAKSR